MAHYLSLLPGILAIFIYGITYGTLFLTGLGGMFLVYIYLQKKRWKILKVLYLVVLSLFFISFICIEGMVMTAWNMEAPLDLKVDYIIVLGAGLKKDTVSNRLRVRLEKGLECVRQHPAAILIVSGGKGPDEEISEAEAMRRYLVSRNFPQSRILLENQSTSTVENLLFSKEIIDKKTIDSTVNAKVLIVTSDYHLFRALRIARRQGYNCAGAAAGSPLGIKLNYTIREYGAMLKDLLWH